MTENDNNQTFNNDPSAVDASFKKTNNYDSASNTSIERTNQNQDPAKPNAKKNRTNRGIMWATIVIAIANVFYALFAYLQYGIMDESSKQTKKLTSISEKQSNIMKKSLETDRLRDRASIYFPNPRVSPYPSRENHYVWEVIIVASNGGNMPARHVSFKYATVKTPSSDNVEDPWPLAKWTSAKFNSTIGPKQSAAFQGRHIPNEIFKKAVGREIDIFILAEVKYIDEFDPNKIRTTQMSRKLRFDLRGGMSQGFTDSHNCSDDDCHQ